MIVYSAIIRKFVACLWLAWIVILFGLTAVAKSVDFKLAGGDILRIEPVASGIIRVRLSVDGKFEPSLMERYGIVRTNWNAVEYTVVEGAEVTRISTSDSVLEVRRNGALRLLDNRSNIICQQIVPLQSQLQEAEMSVYRSRQDSLNDYFKGEKRSAGQSQILGDIQQDASVQPDSMHSFTLAPASNSFGATFSIGTKERFYGLGTASARRIQLRGHAYRLWTQYNGNFNFKGSEHDWEQTEGPIPLLLSTGGWGIFVNTTWVHYYDVGRYSTKHVFFWGPGGQLDFYLLIGKSLPKLLELNTEITGKPRLLPEFGYGLTYLGHITEYEHDLLNDTRLFRDRDIPCDTLEIGPQWMKEFYDYSHEAKWGTPEHFYFPEFLKSRDGTMVGGLDRMGFKLSLWLCCNDDLTLQEEREVAQNTGAKDFPAKPEAWFDHLEKFVKQGVRSFMIDPARIIEEHPTRKYGNGRPDLENHNLTQVLMHKQMALGYEKQITNQRAMFHYCAAYAGVQHWGATTMGDNGGGQKALVWMLNYSMSGHMNTSCDMQAYGPGLHFGFLQPWSLLNSWAYARQPWFLGRKQEAIFRDYARLHYSLMPYIYSAAYQGFLTGLPIVRPMPLVYPDDNNLSDCTYEYMFGDNLLVTAFSEKVYLPAGRWIDYWTGTQYEGPRAMPCAFPANREGGLFIRRGAIIPYWPDMNYVGEEPVESIILHVYPDKQSAYTLYEDDGDSQDYLHGATSQTRIHCEANNGSTTLNIEPRAGKYRSMPARRSYEIWIHQTQPKTVTVTGGNNTGTDMGYDQKTAAVHVMAAEDPARRSPIKVKCE